MQLSEMSEEERFWDQGRDCIPSCLFGEMPPDLGIHCKRCVQMNEYTIGRWLELVSPVFLSIIKDQLPQFLKSFEFHTLHIRIMTLCVK
jgi:hypothetical protein